MDSPNEPCYFVYHYVMEWKLALFCMSVSDKTWFFKHVRQCSWLSLFVVNCRVLAWIDRSRQFTAGHDDSRWSGYASIRELWRFTPGHGGSRWTAEHYLKCLKTRFCPIRTVINQRIIQYSDGNERHKVHLMHLHELKMNWRQKSVH